MSANPALSPSPIPGLGRRRWLVLAMMGIASFMVMVSNTLLNTALPSIARDFEASTATLQWVVNGYTLILAGLLLAGGTFGDRFGRRRLLGIGIAIFGVASFAAALAPNPETIILMRGVQGAGAALVFPATLSILTNVFERRERSIAIGVWSGVTGLGIAVGPLLGGALVDEFEWPAVFWMLVPISVAGLLGLAIVPESRDRYHRALDLPGAVLATCGLVALVYGIVQGEGAGWTSGEIIGAFALALVLLGAFVAVELRTASPMLPLRFFRQKDFDGGVFAIFFVFFALMVIMFFLVQYFQIVQGKSAFRSGLYILPMAMMMMVGAPLSGVLVQRLGPRIMIAVAGTVTMVGILWLTQLQPDSPYWIVLVGLLCFGFGGGMAMAPMTDTVMAAVPVDEAGIGSAINDVCRELGAALGIAVTGSFVAGRYRDLVRDDLGGTVPPQVLDPVSEGVGVAEAVARTLDPATAARVVAAANDAFVQAFTSGFLISAAFMALAVVTTLWLVPRRPRSQQAVEATARALRPTPTSDAADAAGNATPAGGS